MYYIYIFLAVDILWTWYRPVGYFFAINHDLVPPYHFLLLLEVPKVLLESWFTLKLSNMFETLCE